MEISEGLSGVEWANYPLDCRERFLGTSAKCRTASQGMKRHFIYPQVDDILDDYLLWLELNSLEPDTA